MFTFCLYYVLYNRRCRMITPTSPSLVNDPYESLVPKDENDISSSTHSSPKCSFVEYSDYRFIVSIVLLILLGLLSIPIGGLTGFHVFLVARGRTTNEQVTDKYRHQGDVFTKGFVKNFAYLFCQSTYPRLKPPQIKRYNVELFEKMAYGNPHLPNGKKKSTKKISTKVVYEKTKNDNEKPVTKKKKKPIRNENGEKNTIPNIHVNPIDEKGFVILLIIQLKFLFMF